MTLEPRWMSRRGIQLGTEFRYLTETGRGILETEFLPSDDLTASGRQDEIDSGIHPDNWRKDNRGSISFGAAQGVSRLWQARASLNWISDPRWVEDASSSLDGISNISLQSDVGVYGRGRHWDAGVAANYWILSDYTQPEWRLPYHRLPRAYFRWEQPFGRWLVAGAETRGRALRAYRFEHEPRRQPPVPQALRHHAVRRRQLVRAADVRMALHRLPARRRTRAKHRRGQRLGHAGQLAFEQHADHSIDAGLFFDRDTTFRGERFLHTLEPRLFYLNAPYHDQSDMPLFDTRPMTFSWGSCSATTAIRAATASPTPTR